MAKQRGCVTWVDVHGNEVQVTTVVPECYNGRNYAASKFGDEVFVGQVVSYKRGEMRSDAEGWMPPRPPSKSKSRAKNRKRSSK
jgi:hypothetical protein